MKRTLLTLVVVLSALIGGIYSAEASSYTFTIINRLNSYIPSQELNANAVCRVTAKLTTGSGVVATNTIQTVKAAESGTITLSSAVCNLQKVSATCTFKDYTGKVKTETRESSFENCAGGTFYITLEPFVNPKWTSFSINRH